MRAEFQRSINLGAQNKFRVQFSNFPGIETALLVHNLYEVFAKKFDIPSYDLEFMETRFKNNVILQPISKKNDELNSVSITFLLDENLLNYFYLQQFIQKMRYGVGITSDFMYRNTIKNIDLTWLDNQNNGKKRMRFTNAIPQNLGDLSLEFGEAEVPSFTCDFKYREILIEDVGTNE